MNVRFLCYVVLETVLFLFGLSPLVSSRRIHAEFQVILPDSFQFKKLETTVVSETYTLSKNRNLSRYYDLKAVTKVLEKEYPEEILKTFCKETFPNKINTIMYLNINPSKSLSSSDYIMSIAQALGYPFISWNPDLPSTSQVCYSNLLSMFTNRFVILLFLSYQVCCAKYGTPFMDIAMSDRNVWHDRI